MTPQDRPDSATKMPSEGIGIQTAFYWNLLESQELFPHVCERGPFFDEKAVFKGNLENWYVVGV